eukprot:1784374-Prymnesium_polylepis.1
MPIPVHRTGVAETDHCGHRPTGIGHPGTKTRRGSTHPTVAGGVQELGSNRSRAEPSLDQLAREDHTVVTVRPGATRRRRRPRVATAAGR